MEDFINMNSQEFQSVTLQNGTIENKWQNENSILKAQVRMTPSNLESVSLSSLDVNDKINRIHKAKNICRTIYTLEEYDILGREYFVMLGLNRSNKIQIYSLVSMGGVNGTIADGKIIFKTAILSGCSAIILCHNHPSGNIEPSPPDISLTERLTKFGAMIDLPIIEHIILTENSYYSFVENDLI